MKLKSAWYIACTSHELKAKAPKAATILGVRLALFRNAEGQAAALEDRCLHRMAQLSKGSVCKGQIVCPYHGWAYDGQGKVQDIPATCPSKKSIGERRLRNYPVIEKEGYVYVYLNADEAPEGEPFSIPKFAAKGYHHIRLINEFDNTVTNCVENFVDIPHTVFVHPGIFRVRRNQRFTARIIRDQGRVTVHYQNERENLGIFSWFLNPHKKEIVHRDHFIAPNITSVEYDMGPQRHFFITSQSIPIGERKTLVYTDLTYDYGIWNRLAAPLVRRSAQTIIDQDKVILRNQNENLLIFGEAFQNTSSDLIHVFIESIRHALEKGEDPRLLPYKEKEIEFWV
jgi:phenylpropionate dioxygenase-like ring-hydroxylating dioxygenase large terminal subunit